MRRSNQKPLNTEAQRHREKAEKDFAFLGAPLCLGGAAGNSSSTAACLRNDHRMQAMIPSSVLRGFKDKSLNSSEHP
jgi:hypothetical protein